ncbi:MAG TPA: alpha/beta hydrolase [Candidatus Angelobacter sp.]
MLVGHSLAGEELSSVASRYPNRVAAVVYLDAAYQYAFDNGKGTAMSEFQGNEPRPPAPGPDDLASFSAYAKRFARVNGVALPESEFRQGWDSTPDGKVGKRRIPPGAAGIKVGMKKYANIPVPALAIFAVPHDLGAWVKASSDPTVQEAARTFTALETPLTERQAKAFEEGVPNAHVVRLAGASHFIFLSNQADVLREMHAFVMAIAPR